MRSPSPVVRISVALPLTLGAVLLTLAFSNGLAAQEPTDTAPVEPPREFLQRYCFDCHGSEEPEAKLDLTELSSHPFATTHRIWDAIRRRVAAGEMPPADADPAPTAGERQSLSAWVLQQRDREANRRAGDPGEVLTRRLSNAEYNRTVRDLTGVDIQPAAVFPVDPANEAGFDNSGESLTMSPALLKKYLEAARSVAEHAVLTPDGIDFAPHTVQTDTDRDKYCVKRIVAFYRRQPTDYADYFLAAWKFRVQASKTTKPSLDQVAKETAVSARYLKRIVELLGEEDGEENGEKDGAAVGPIARLQQMFRKLPNDAASANAARKGCVRMRDYIERVRPQLVPSVEPLKVQEIHAGAQSLVLWRNRQYAANRQRLNRDVFKVAGDDKQLATGDAADLLLPADPKLREQHIASWERFCRIFPDAFYIDERGRDYVDNARKQDGERGRLLSAGFHSMMGYFRDDAPLYDMVLTKSQQQELDRLWDELNFVCRAPSRQYVGFLWFERTDSRYMRDSEFDFARPENRKALETPLIERLADVYLAKARRNGAGDAESDAIRFYFADMNRQIRKVERQRRDAEPAHIQSVVDLATRAFRRPLRGEEAQELRAFYKERREEDGLSHEQAIQDTIVLVFMSPSFCYRTDLSAANQAAAPLTDIELASRLSYFLWASMPDAELMKAATDGTLRQPDVLLRQTRRMLQDPKVRGLAIEFGANWLDFRRFEQHNAVDRKRFPQFTDELRAAMFEEPVQFFVDVAREDRSVRSFLNADHMYVNGVLAKHYGVKLAKASDDDWQRVDNARQHGRGGLLPMSVFLTKNAPGLRTSPVKRGYWVVRRLLGEEIPPPPPNVPDLPDDEAKLGERTLREALARHRENVACAGCHNRFDSIGLTFEAFGPIGERRENDLAGRSVSVKAEFPDGSKGSGMEGLRTYLESQRMNDFEENLARKLLSYALGRTLILPDELMVQQMIVHLHDEDHRFGSLIEAIVTSPQFLNKRGAVNSNGP